ncbi:MAG TPA: OmpA family protein [Rhodocyclaceae bacterium]|nr:OmpA family protein [Rhodocyclaceae bacterium]
MQHEISTIVRPIALSIALLGANAMAPVSAQDSQPAYNPSWYGYLGANYFDPEDHFHAAKNGWGATARLGKPVAQYWDLQIGTAWSRTWDEGGSYRQNTLGADMLLLFSRSKFRPFLLAGAGAQFDIPRTDIHGAGTAPFITGGLGFQYLFTDRLGMQADYRLAHAFVDPRGYGFSHANTKLFNLGLIWAFGKTPAPYVAAAAPAAAPAPAPAPTPAPPPPPPAPKFQKTTLSASELFAFNSAALQPAQPKLDDLASALIKDTSNASITVNGYTDRLGSHNYNMKLSQQRADAVKTYLVSKGVPAERVTAVGKGEADPVVTCTQKARKALITCLEPNRRVEIEDVTVTHEVK